MSPERLEIIKYSFIIMGKGMLAIFVVMIILMLITLLLAWATNLRSKKKIAS
ncbi:MAG: hypothetical protein WBI07_08180 [Mobilitalea sp.]